MTARIIDGKAIAAAIRQKLAEEVRSLKEQNVEPGLAVILVGDNPASRTYVNMKKKACGEVGIRSDEHQLPADIEEAELISLVQKLNSDPQVDGILVQLPLPRHINADTVIRAIDPDKDVDGFHPVNVGRLWAGLSHGFLPCTPAGIMELLRRTGIDLTGKEAVVLGRSNIVGKPVAALLMRENATVTICHSRTNNIAEHCRRADVLVAAVGRPHFVSGDWIKPGAVVIDVGINRVDGKLTGDVDFEAARAVAGHITPVPGGVGPMTIAYLLKNTVAAAHRRRGQEYSGSPN